MQFHKKNFLFDFTSFFAWTFSKCSSPVCEIIVYIFCLHNFYISSTLGSTTGVASANGNGGRRCVSVNDIRRAFEKAEQSLQQAAAKGYSGMSPCHNRMSSLDSTNSDESSIPTPQHCYGSVSSLISGQTNMRDHYGSISSLASSTSLISPQVRIFENIKRRLCIPTSVM